MLVSFLSSDSHCRRCLFYIVSHKTKFPYFGKKIDLHKISKNWLDKNIFNRKKIPYRLFYILKKNEEELGVLFTFFVLETILLSKFLKINPFDQPAVESIKKSTKNILLKI